VSEPLAQSMNEQRLEGVRFRPVVFEPTFHKHARQACGGCQIHVTDRRRFRPVLAAVALMKAFYDADPERFAWRQPPYEYEHELMPIDILAGSGSLRSQIEGGIPWEDIRAGWEPATRRFLDTRRGFLIY